MWFDFDVVMRLMDIRTWTNVLFTPLFMEKVERPQESKILSSYRIVNIRPRENSKFSKHLPQTHRFVYTVFLRQIHVFNLVMQPKYDYDMFYKL